MRTPDERTALGRSFDRAAVAYEAGRPGYPAELVDWWASVGALTPGSRVLDLAAGTGKLTRAFAGRGVDVVAVEPLANMRAAFRDVAELTDIDVLDGSAEQIPLPDGSVDAVFVGQAFHWFDPAPALAEIVRVLQPGGGLGLAWNDDDPDGAPAWVQLVHDRKNGIGGGTIRLGVDASVAAVEGSGRFGPVAASTVRWSHRTTAAQELDSLASRSYVISMEPAARQAVLDELRAAIGGEPDDDLDHPLTTAAFWARRR